MMKRNERRLVAGNIIIASTEQLWQTWRKHRPEHLPDGWRVWALSGMYGIQPSPIEYHRLERGRIEEIAKLVATQWNASVAASIVMVGSWNYQEVAIRARLNWSSASTDATCARSWQPSAPPGFVWPAVEKYGAARQNAAPTVPH